MHLTFVPDDTYAVGEADVRTALDTIQRQIATGATAGNLKLNGHEPATAVCRVKWAIDGELEM
jgi:hypothetical protein